MSVEFFADYHTPTVLYARTTDNDWFVVPVTSNGWSQRRPWSPPEVATRRMARKSNRHSFFGLDWLAEISIGLPMGMLHGEGQ